MKKFLSIILCVIFCFIFAGCGVSQSEYDAVVKERDALAKQVTELGGEVENPDSSSLDNESNSKTEKKADTKEEYTFGSSFEFDDLEITLGSNFSMITLDNQLSDLDGNNVIKLPIKVKNLSDETHGLNMFYFKFYGSKGTELDSVSAYFDDDVSWSGEMRPDSELETNMHILYDGDGDYYIELDNYSTKIEVKLPITK